MVIGDGLCRRGYALLGDELSVGFWGIHNLLTMCMAIDNSSTVLLLSMVWHWSLTLSLLCFVASFAEEHAQDTHHVGPNNAKDKR